MRLFENPLTETSSLEKIISASAKRFRLPEWGEAERIDQGTRLAWINLYAVTYGEELPQLLFRLASDLWGMPVLKTCDRVVLKHFELHRGQAIGQRHGLMTQHEGRALVQEKAHWIRQAFHSYHSFDSLLLAGVLLAFQLEFGIPWLAELIRPGDIYVYPDIGEYVISFDPNSHDAGDINDLIMAVEGTHGPKAEMRSADDTLLALETAATIFSWCIPPALKKNAP